VRCIATTKQVKTIPLLNIDRIEIYQNTSKLDFQSIVKAKKPDVALNGVYFNGLWQAEGHVKVDGTVVSTEPWGYWGYTWDTGSDIQMVQLPENGRKNYISCLDLINPWDGPNAALYYDKSIIGGNRGRTAIGLTDTALVAYCVQDGSADATTPEGVRDILAAEGCTTAIELDSGSSSNMYADGEYILSSRQKVQNLILIYLKEEPKKQLYRVQVGAFSVKSNAENLLSKLRTDGYSGFIVESEV
jgi:hypothetical protein